MAGGEAQRDELGLVAHLRDEDNAAKAMRTALMDLACQPRLIFDSPAKLSRVRVRKGEPAVSSG